jgi:hypothetical protein
VVARWRHVPRLVVLQLLRVMQMLLTSDPFWLSLRWQWEVGTVFWVLKPSSSVETRRHLGVTSFAPPNCFSPCAYRFSSWPVTDNFHAIITLPTASVWPAATRFALFTACFFLQSRLRRPYVSPKRRWAANELHGVTGYKVICFTILQFVLCYFTYVRTIIRKTNKTI